MKELIFLSLLILLFSTTESSKSLKKVLAAIKEIETNMVTYDKMKFFKKKIVAEIIDALTPIIEDSCSCCAKNKCRADFTLYRMPKNRFLIIQCFCSGNIYLLLVAYKNRTASKRWTKMVIFFVTCLMCLCHLEDMEQQWTATYFVEGSVLAVSKISNKTAFITMQAKFFMDFFLNI